MHDDDTPSISDGLCQCGCGQPAPIAKRTYTKLGVTKGQPWRYLPYHRQRQRLASGSAEVSADGATARVPLYGRDGSIRAYAIIDAADAEWVSQWRWHLNDGYARRTEWIPGGRFRAFKLHRELLGLTPDDAAEVDHINRDTLDNRRANLRKATHSGNMQNTSSHADTSSRYRGVSWNKGRRRWQAYLSVGGRKVTIGRYRTEEEAHEAVSAARLRLMPFATD